jgi:hypothetical protein
MSEYQYYEFQALDRPLTPKQMAELRRLSSRAEITPTSFINTYNYGDFRGDPVKLMEKCFDAFVYVANWGTHRLMFRVPRSLFDVDVAKAYVYEESLKVYSKENHVIVEFCSHDEGGGYWEDGQGYLEPLLPIRNDLMAGDFRSLYLGWLSGVVCGLLEEDDVEPPVPPGLGKLSETLKALAKFLRVPPAPIDVAAITSLTATRNEPAATDLAAWIADMAETEKNALLVRLLEGESPHLRSELSQRFQSFWNETHKKPGFSDSPGRTVGELTHAFENREKVLRERAERKAAEKKAREERERAAAWAEFLNALSQRSDSAWHEADALIATKDQSNYAKAVEMLKGLKELAGQAGRLEEAGNRIKEIRKRHASKSALMRRLRQGGL